MKRVLLLGCAVIICCFTALSREYPKNIFGLRAGINIPWVTSYGVHSSKRVSYSVGFTDQVLLNRYLPFYFETGLNFTSKGYKVQGFDNSKTTLNYLQLPVSVNYHIYAGKDVTIEPSAGFYYAYGVGGKFEHRGYTSRVFSQGNISPHDCGFSFGLRASIHSFYLGMSYETGIVNIDKWDAVYGEGCNMIGYKNIKNKNILIMVGVNF